MGCGHPVGAMKKLGEDLVEGLADDFKEYKELDGPKEELDKELQDLRSEAKGIVNFGSVGATLTFQIIKREDSLVMR